MSNLMLNLHRTVLPKQIRLTLWTTQVNNRVLNLIYQSLNPNHPLKLSQTHNGNLNPAVSPLPSVVLSSPSTSKLDVSPASALPFSVCPTTNS